MDHLNRGLLLLITVAMLQTCATAGRPESRRRFRRSDMMHFPNSQEETTMRSMRQRTLLQTPPPRKCNDIQVVQYRNGTRGYRVVECNNTMSIPSRFDGNESMMASNNNVNNMDGSAPTKDNIVFPENESGESTEPTCAKDKGFCTGEESYPKSQIDALISRGALSHLDDMLQSDIILDNEVTQRVGIPGEDTFCDYEVKMEYPTRAQNRDDKWLPILNHANYTQGIRMERCKNADKPCKMADYFPFSIKTKCVQKYQYRQLVSLQEDGTLKKDYFSMPTCCLCVYIKM